MLNYRVDDLHQVLQELRAEAVQVVEQVEENEFGRFGWIFVPEGNKIELWQPYSEARPSRRAYRAACVLLARWSLPNMRLT